MTGSPAGVTVGGGASWAKLGGLGTGTLHSPAQQYVSSAAAAAAAAAAATAEQQHSECVWRLLV
jgi:hypothetical protein